MVLARIVIILARPFRVNRPNSITSQQKKSRFVVGQVFRGIPAYAFIVEVSSTENA